MKRTEINTGMFELSDPPRSARSFVYTLLVIGSVGATHAANADAPTIAGSPRLSVYADTWYKFIPTASDADGDELSFSVENLPSWAGFVPSRGEVWGRPGPGDVGTYWSVRIRVSDGSATTALQSFPIEVRASGAPNGSPTISGVPRTSVEPDSWYTFVPTAADADGDRLNFSIENKPDWAEFIESRGELWGRPGPGDAGTYDDVRISVSDGVATAALPGFAIEVTAGGSSNSPPTISGTPRTSVEQDRWYKFVPAAGDADGDELGFGVENLPDWAGFVPSRGEVWGRPGPGDVGTYSGLRISVSDGVATTALPSFTISVIGSGSGPGSATLSWQAPTQNTDGSALTDLAGYVVYWGTSSGQYTDSAVLENPGLTSYVVEDLASGAYYFAVKSFNTEGVRSDYSPEASKTIP